MLVASSPTTEIQQQQQKRNNNANKLVKLLSNKQKSNLCEFDMERRLVLWFWPLSPFVSMKLRSVLVGAKNVYVP